MGSARLIKYLDSVGMEKKSKAALALTFHQRKPASLITMYQAPGGYEEKVREDFASIGVYGEPMDRVMIQKGGPEVLNIIVAANQFFLKEMLEAYPKYRQSVPMGCLNGIRAPEETETKIGRLLGYPENSIQAYTGKRKALPRQELDVMADPEITPYLWYNCSEKGWKEEIKTAENWSKFMAMHYPALHEDFVRTFWSRTKNYCQ